MVHDSTHLNLAAGPGSTYLASNTDEAPSGDPELRPELSRAKSEGQFFGLRLGFLSVQCG